MLVSKVVFYDLLFIEREGETVLELDHQVQIPAAYQGIFLEQVPN